jgi:hypothetical protein
MSARRWVCATFTVAGIAACDNGRFEDLQGWYDISVTLETFSYQIPGAVPGVDCAGTSPCWRTEPANGAKLSTTLQVGSRADDTELGAAIFNAGGEATATWCAAIDKATGCTALKDSTFRFSGTFVEASDLYVRVRLEQSAYYGSLLLLNSPPLQGDSLHGDCSWIVPGGGSGYAPIYMGRCVAHKRR